MSDQDVLQRLLSLEEKLDRLLAYLNVPDTPPAPRLTPEEQQERLRRVREAALGSKSS